MLKLIYTFFLGLLLAIFIGVGIATFYPGPQTPDVPPALEISKPSTELSPEERRQQEEYNQQWREYRDDQKIYSRNISLIALVFSLTFLVISLVFAKQLTVLSDGFLLGGLFLLLYSIGNVFVSEDAKYRFIVVSAGLFVAIILGYIKFGHTEEKH